MGKLFTISEGLENMGALRSGGQGSVYKARRTGAIVTAVKLLPTPIHSESAQDKNFLAFQSEVEKLKKVNQRPNPHVVKILSSGITETGSLPFIEMEFIEGPDLEELLRPPHPPLFTLKEALKVGEQLSSALAHCHSIGVKHGDIKSNNVKYNIHSGNYVLLDFGLAVMSDEQRRSSLRHAGAIEFMAPEQNEGQMLFQTDVYSFGIVLYELLAGRVPFPLGDRGETGRNSVMLSHMEAPVPDVQAIRKEHMPQSWTGEQRSAEERVPDWMVQLINRCLEKDPRKRFENGEALHHFISQHLLSNNTISAVAGNTTYTNTNTNTQQLSALKEENEKLKEELAQYRNGKNGKEIALLQDIVRHKDAELNELKAAGAGHSQTKVARQGVSKASFFALLFLTIGLAALAGYALLKDNDNSSIVGAATDSTAVAPPPVAANNSKKNKRLTDTNTKKPAPQKKDKNQQNKPPDDEVMLPDDTEPQRRTTEGSNAAAADKQNGGEEKKEPKKGDRYKVVDKAYFHNEPNESTRRNAFIVHWNNAVLTPLNDKDDFVYVVYTNDEGQTSKGWLRKKDLRKISE